MFYFNVEDPISIYTEIVHDDIYVDKSMLAAYYTKGYDTRELFDYLKISHSDNYLTHLNQHNVVYIDFSIMSNECCSYDDYIQMITHNMISDLKSQYTIDLTPNHPLSQYFRKQEIHLFLY